MTNATDARLLEAAHAAINLMEDFGFEPSVKVFDVFFSYTAKSHTPLVASMQGLLDSSSLTKPAVDKLYNTYLSSAMSTDEIDNLSTKLQHEVDALMSQVDETQAGTTAFTENLDSSERKLKDTHDPEVIKVVLSEMITETQKMSDLTNSLGTQLESSKSEVQELRWRLAESRKEAETDALTTLANRKGFDSALRTSIDTSMKDTENICLCLVDIDHFKKFNDTHGHQLGDLVLRMVALTMKKSARRQDFVARYGGEEFVIIFPNTDLETATSVADHVRVSIEQRKLIKKDDNTSLGRVTVSIGVSKFDPAQSFEKFIQRADKALYAAKDAGRNRVLTELDLN